VKRILGYIARGSHDHGVRYERGKAGELLLLRYSYSDVAGDVDDNRSTSGILFYLVKNPRYIARGSHDHRVRCERGKAGELLLLPI
jgi:hypothetical protein